MKEQIDELAVIAPEIENPGLKARIADVVWVAQRRYRRSGLLAISSYCDCVDKIIGRQTTIDECRRDDEVKLGLEFIKRACTIADSISSKGKEKPAEVRRIHGLVDQVLKEWYKKRNGAYFSEIACISLEHGLAPAEEIAAQAESLAASSENFIMIEQKLWKTAACAHKKNKDKKKERRCALEACELLVEEARGRLHYDEQPHHHRPGGGTARYVQSLEEAVSCLQKYSEPRERHMEIRKEIEQAKQKIPSEISIVNMERPTKEELMEAEKNAKRAISGLSFRNAIFKMLKCDRPPGEAEEILNKDTASSPPITICGYQMQTRHRASSLKEDPKLTVSLLRMHQRCDSVLRHIDPMRRAIAERYDFDNKTVEDLFNESPFVPPGYENFFIEGMRYFLNSKYLEASSLLIPQLENSLRHLLRNNEDILTRTRDNKGVERFVSLKTIVGP